MGIALWEAIERILLSPGGLEHLQMLLVVAICLSVRDNDPWASPSTFLALTIWGARALHLKEGQVSEWVACVVHTREAPWGKVLLFTA